MPHQKMSVPIWTHKIVKKNGKKFVHLPLPDNTEIIVEFESTESSVLQGEITKEEYDILHGVIISFVEELKAAQYKARATAKGIVHAKFSYAF
jgi:hypothetical protein